ncbi:carbon storage regulator [Paludisphaera rhizosphaerae]|uniref:carbon storage regulator n=1 Tax=Paludisphaera rhizosphaerae TaxID=2711216 RepID=UPI0013EAE934|nr:carbon storage regulator [Paludisphaera rhizosphaerae]
MDIAVPVSLINLAMLVSLREFVNEFKVDRAGVSWSAQQRSERMLALIRSLDEAIVIQTQEGEVVVRLDRIRRDKRSAVITVKAPRSMNIFREEGDRTPR